MHVDLTPITKGTVAVEFMNCFNYLGSTVTNTGDLNEQINSHQSLAAAIMQSLWRTIWSSLQIWDLVTQQVTCQKRLLDLSQRLYTCTCNKQLPVHSLLQNAYYGGLVTCGAAGFLVPAQLMQSYASCLLPSLLMCCSWLLFLCRSLLVVQLFHCVSLSAVLGFCRLFYTIQILQCMLG